MLYLCYFFTYFKVSRTNLGGKTESKRTLDVAISATMHFLWINPKYDA